MPASRRFACEDGGSRRRRVAEQWSRLIVCKLPKRHGEDPGRDSGPRMTPPLARMKPFQILVIENRPRALTNLRPFAWNAVISIGTKRKTSIRRWNEILSFPYTEFTQQFTLHIPWNWIFFKLDQIRYRYSTIDRNSDFVYYNYYLNGREFWIKEIANRCRLNGS